MALVLLAILAADPAGAARSLPEPDRPGLEEAAPSRALVVRIQRSLAREGLYQGPSDGHLSAAVIDAIRAFQRRAGLAVDGRATRSLADHLDTTAGALNLMNRLEEARRTNRAKARAALAGGDATRDLLGPPQTPLATRAQGFAPCRAAPTVACLLDDALAESQRVPKDEMRDWVLGEVMAVQARLGQDGAARDSLRRVADPRVVLTALRTLAAVQAESGRDAAALATARSIPVTSMRAEALGRIARAQADGGR
ncbi:MAG: peptidoglycan-binding protein, partial [Rhodobacterales bacterium]|nr:peptidoglycan-binding protein [Rhodobacterales bacterium]